MATSAEDYFRSGLNITNGQVIKSEGIVSPTSSYFNGNANQFNGNHQQPFTYDNAVYNTSNII
jgi:hypothetical protein